jgi:hypothetical protein
MEPCSGPSENAQLLNMVLNALNVALAAWLVNRRNAADRRERNGSNGKHGPTDKDNGRMTQEQIDKR